jgi:hypothetical protein
MKLTTRTVAALLPHAQGDTCVWDSELPGFGLRIKPTGVRSFIVQYRNPSRVSRRITIGKFGVLTVEEARKLAKGVLADVVKGGDPAQKRSEERKAMSVHQLCRAYLEAADKGLILGKRGQAKRASTRYVDQGRITRHILPLLGNRLVRDLTTPDIARFMRDVAAGKTADDAKTKLRGRAIVKGGRGTATRTVGLLGGMLSFAVSEGIISANPARGVKRPADGRREVRLSAEQYNVLGQALIQAEALSENPAATTTAPGRAFEVFASRKAKHCATVIASCSFDSSTAQSERVVSLEFVIFIMSLWIVLLLLRSYFAAVVSLAALDL